MEAPNKRKAPRIKTRAVTIGDPVEDGWKVIPKVQPRYLAGALNTALERIGMNRNRLGLNLGIDPSFLVRLNSGTRTPSIHMLSYIVHYPEFKKQERFAIVLGAMVDIGALSEVDGAKVMRIMELLDE